MIDALKTKIFIAVLVTFSFVFVNAQDSPTWDNQMYLGNKIAFGKNKWRFSGELQVRLKDNFQKLDNWYLEFVSNYLISEHFEIVPDFRFTIKPEKVEWRPGFGVLYKKTTPKIQFVNQVKWQIDIPNHGDIGNAVREVVFLNHKFNEKIISTLIAGFIYRWWPGWNGFQYIRVGPGVSFIFDEKHILNFSYFVGVENNTEEWLWAGIPMLQLVINLSKSEKYKYTPAYYFDF
ncbi:MAG: hypothetical protein GXO86_12560 [Chlorobi bacterium]|nr:hypothetical protein [Chlorobiota bacterium]